MSGSYINKYIADLQRQISASAAKIKRQDASSKDKNAENQAVQDNVLSYNVDVRSYKLMVAESSYALLGGMMQPDNGYATSVYSSISCVDKKPTVAEGLVFENNREFDFRI